MSVTLVLAAAAGILSILSPCVLPLVPIVLATALGQHRFGPAALAAPAPAQPAPERASA